LRHRSRHIKRGPCEGLRGIISGEGYAVVGVVWTGVEMGWRIGGLRYLR